MSEYSERLTEPDANLREALLRRYGRVFAHAWKHRQEMEPEARLRHEAEFLPAALALQDSPVSPAPRVAMWLIMLFVLIALVWAFVGKIDVVATKESQILRRK